MRPEARRIDERQKQRHQQQLQDTTSAGGLFRRLFTWISVIGAGGAFYYMVSKPPIEAVKAIAENQAEQFNEVEKYEIEAERQRDETAWRNYLRRQRKTADLRVLKEVSPEEVRVWQEAMAGQQEEGKQR